MKKCVLLFFLLILMGCSSKEGEGLENVNSFAKQKKKEQIISAWVIGPEKTSLTRMTNLQEAVDNINKRLKMNGRNEIILKVEFWTGKPIDFRRKFQNAFKLGIGPDILCIAHEEIPVLVESGYIAGLDQRIKEDKSGILAGIFPNLWKACSYKGKIYAIPQDTEVRGIYYRKDILKQLGWSQVEIENFPKKVEKGFITQYDLIKIALEAKKRGLVQWGIFHRPTTGVSFFHHLIAFGAKKLQDERTGKMIFSKQAMLKTLTYYYDIVHRYKLMPKEMTTLSWQIMDSAIPKGRILFNITGGSWNKSEYIHDQGMSEKEFYQKVGFSLIPPERRGGEPLTLSHPLVYVINSQSAYQDTIFQILTEVSKAEFTLKHALLSSHLVISKEGESLKGYLKDSFLKYATSFLKYTRVVPNNAKYHIYERVFFDAIKRVEMLGEKPEIAVKRMIEELNKWAGDEIIYE